MSGHDLTARKALMTAGACGLGAGMKALAEQAAAALRSFGLVMEPILTVRG
jgi:hypothetical protein